MSLHNRIPDIVGPHVSHTENPQEPLLVVQSTHPDGPPEWVWREDNLMKALWPQFSLEIADDNSICPKSFCWSGKLKPGIYQNLEWDITAVCLGLGDGRSDWSGAIAIYFINPSGRQVIETLGYKPACMLFDAHQNPILCNIRPIRLQNCTVAEAIWLAFRFCHTVEQMCTGHHPENILRDNRFMSNWENENFPIPYHL